MFTEWMDRFVEFAITWFYLVLLATWRALPIFVIVAGIGLALRRKLSPALHALLLTLVLVRLLMPISIGSPTSLHKPIDNLFSSELVEAARRQSQSYHHAVTFLPNVERVDVQSGLVQQEAQFAINPFTWEDVLGTVVLLIVGLVTIVLILRSVLSHFRFALKLRSCRLLEDRHLIDLVLRECDSLGVGRRPALREVPSIAAPAVFGLFRQTICLPPGLNEKLNEQELRWVVRHELAHIRRRDIPVTIIASIACAFHWFNPIVWMIANRLRAAVEASADRLALKGSSPNEVTQYGELLLRLAQESTAAKSLPTLGMISFASGKHLKQRVELLMRDSKPNGAFAKCLSAGLVGAIAFVGLTDAREVKDLHMPVVNLISNASTEREVLPLWFDPIDELETDGSTFVETYDLTSIFETMPKRSVDEIVSLERLTAYIPFPMDLKDKLHLDGDTLSAELTTGQHRRLKQRLDIWKEGEAGQIGIEARFIQTNMETASSIEWTERRIDGLIVRGLGPAIAARIDDAELLQLIRTVSEDSRGNTLFAPRVTLWDGQTAVIADQVQRPFVTGIDPKSDAGMLPVVSFVDEGLSLILTPKVGEKDSVTLGFKVIASSIGKVSYANLPIKAANNSEPQFTVQVPSTEQYEISSSVTLAAGESVAVAIPRVFDNKPGADAETTMIVVLTPKVIPMQ